MLRVLQLYRGSSYSSYHSRVSQICRLPMQVLSSLTRLHCLQDIVVEITNEDTELNSSLSTHYPLSNINRPDDGFHSRRPMATRLTKRFASRMFVSKQRHDEIAILRSILPRVRWASSSSESGEAAVRKPTKKKSDRLSGVIDAVNDRKLPPELRGQRKNIRSETDIINVVEQRIWHSMEEGHFENLPGKGKPLNLNTNPHADPAEDTLYRILSRNKCAPEWVELNKGIRSDVAEWRLILKKAWSYKESGDLTKWNEYSDSLKVQLRIINNKVFRYNLIVPFGRQMFGLKWEKEVARLDQVAADA